MKKNIQIFTSFLIAAVLFIGCEKDENKVFFEGGTKPVLTASTSAVNLDPLVEQSEALRLNWTNPDYQFTTGVSSQDVNYTLEMDTLGGDFKSGARYSTSIARDLVKSFTVFELNNILGNSMLLTLGRTHTIEARVTSTLGAGAVPQVSDKVSFTAKPYAPPPKVEPPADGTLWITGDAAKSGWANPLGNPYNVEQQFTKLSNTLYELVLDMPGGGNYKLIQKQGDWGSQYHMLAGGSAEGGSFEKRDADPAFIGPAVAGTYKITVDFQLGKFTVVKQ
jgi:hypothetical protein